MKRSLPAINIQFPISKEIVSKRKTIETRFYPLPEQYIGKPMWLVETPGKTGKFKARATGIITFASCFQYKSAEEFYRDTSKHLVTKNSEWRWQGDKKKWGWVIAEVKPLSEPIDVHQRRGILYTASLTLSS